MIKKKGEIVPISSTIATNSSTVVILKLVDVSKADKILDSCVI